jgi:hypothetical protein
LLDEGVGGVVKNILSKVALAATLAMVLGLMLCALVACGAQKEGEAPGDANADASTGAESDADADANAEAGADANADAGTEAEAGGNAGVANPAVPVSSPAVFLEELGIVLQPDRQGFNPEFSIIGEQVAQIEYGLEVDGAEVQVVARAQKTPEAEDISGIYDTFDLVEPGQAVGDVIPTLSYNEGGAGYVMWYDQATGISGAVSVSTAASATLLDTLAQTYLAQSNTG